MSLPVGEALEGWKPPERPSTVALEGRWVSVSPLAADAVAGLWKALGDDEHATWTYMGYGPFASRSELEDLVESWVGGDDPVFFTFDVEGQPQGWGAYLRINPAAGSVEVGHLVFGPGLRRTAAATEAMYLMARRVFETGYRRYEWKCDALNHRSRGAAERLGFIYEGTFRQHMVYKGRNRDTAWYSMLDTEWPERRHRFETWLDPANFDSSGAQIHRLSGGRGGGVDGGGVYRSGYD